MRIDDIAGQFGIAFGLPFSRVPFHPEVLALDVAKATWLLEKSAVTRWTAHAYFADFGRRENDSDPLHLRRLLRSGREWPRSRSTKCRDEIAPSHVPPGTIRLQQKPSTLGTRPFSDKWPQPIKLDVSVGSKTELSGLARHVRFTLRSRQRQLPRHVRLVP